MVVADFDYTLTVRYGENGEKGCLTHEVFNDGRKLDDGSSTVGELQRQMNEDYRATYSLCSSDEERSCVNTGWDVIFFRRTRNLVVLV
ncbi:hypothetical protein RB195_006765 [Necator americanus]|uniref:5'-nucleotidase n=1 Tax=Necator americanus TaxID=51031 RepID=A0ABR1BU42_NECAM